MVRSVHCATCGRENSSLIGTYAETELEDVDGASRRRSPACLHPVAALGLGGEGRADSGGG